MDFTIEQELEFERILYMERIELICNDYAEGELDCKSLPELKQIYGELCMKKEMDCN